VLAETAKVLKLIVRGLEMKYDVEKQELTIDDVRALVPLIDGKLDLHIFVDRTGIEVFAAGGEVFMPINYNLEQANQFFSIHVDGGKAILENFELYKLKSIW